MDHEHFREALRRDGYLDVETRSAPPGRFVDTHSHPFDVRLLVLDGSARITCGGEVRDLAPGDVYELEANVPHTEQYGPQGYTFLVGRRHVAL